MQTYDLSFWQLKTMADTTAKEGEETFYSVQGRCHGNPHHTDGHTIRSSEIQGLDFSSEENTLLVHTVNSVYRCPFELHEETFDDLAMLSFFVPEEEAEALAKRIEKEESRRLEIKKKELASLLSPTEETHALFEFSSGADNLFKGLLIRYRGTYSYSERYDLRPSADVDMVLLEHTYFRGMTEDTVKCQICIYPDHRIRFFGLPAIIKPFYVFNSGTRELQIEGVQETCIAEPGKLKELR